MGLCVVAFTDMIHVYTGMVVSAYNVALLWSAVDWVVMEQWMASS